MLEPSALDLRAWGYAPGGYLGRPCMDCQTRLEDVDKRAWRCKACATKLYEEQQAMAAELEAIGPIPSGNFSDRVSFTVDRAAGFQNLEIKFNARLRSPEEIDWAIKALQTLREVVTVADPKDKTDA